jgi:hypothetical protein
VNWARVITTLVVHLAAWVDKSRATPIYPFLYHLYERKELLRLEEEKAWKIQEGMLKYGESGSEDKAGSASGSNDEEDDGKEEEEETQVLLNRPLKRPRQEDKSKPGLSHRTSFGKITSEGRRPGSSGRPRVRTNVRVGQLPVDGPCGHPLADGPGGRHLPDGQSCGRAHSHPTEKQPGTS